MRKIINYGTGQKDVQEVEVSNNDAIISYLKSIKHNGEIVFLLILEKDDKAIILVDEDLDEMLDLIATKDLINYVISLHVYESYEEAYSVALDIREINPLCYSK